LLSAPRAASSEIAALRLQRRRGNAALRGIRLSRVPVGIKREIRNSTQFRAIPENVGMAFSIEPKFRSKLAYTAGTLMNTCFAKCVFANN
jgi:hypothetical protein